MINKVTLLGRLGQDVQVHTFDSGAKVASFSLATSERYKNKQGEKVENTEWHNVKIFIDGLVGVADKYLKKGNLVYLEGKIKTSQWDDKDGNKRSKTDIICNSFKMLGGQATTSNENTSEKDNDDLPF